MNTLLVFTFSLLFFGTVFAADLPEPVLLTSAGQSADLHTAKLMLKKAGLDSTKMIINKLAGASDVPKNATLAIVSGASQKGLGEARISTSSEIDRVKTLLQAAKTNKTKVLLIHIGGKERRGELSDGINKAVADGSDYFLVRSEGDTDGFFKKIATTNKKTYIVYSKTPDAIEKLKLAFGK